MQQCPCLNEEKFWMTTFENEASARYFAANCGEKVVILPHFVAIDSFYIWENHVHSSAECALVAHYPANSPLSVQLLKKAHPYQTPELIFSEATPNTEAAALTMLQLASLPKAKIFELLQALVVAKEVACAQYVAQYAWVWLKSAQPLPQVKLDAIAQNFAAKTLVCREVFAEQDYAAWLRESCV